MGFKKVVPPERTTCYCYKPSSSASGALFGPGTIWVCDAHGLAWEYVERKTSNDWRGDSYDVWKRVPEHDGPDPREIAKPSNVASKPKCRCPQQCAVPSYRCMQ